MILYSVISSLHLLNAITHKCSFHEKTPSVLLISHFLFDKYPNFNSLTLYFEKIVVFSAHLLPKTDSYPESNDTYFLDLFRKNNFSISDFSEIHVMGAHYSFGAYVAHNNIPFFFWEDAAGLLSRKNIVIEIDRKFSETKILLCEKYGLYDGSSPSVIGKIGLISAQVQGFSDETFIGFDTIKELLSLNSNVSKLIVSFFTSVEKIDIPLSSTIVLTQHLANLRVMSLYDQILLYQNFVDYFFPAESLVIKPHPDDLLFYSRLFPSAIVIHEKFPSEFFPLILSNKPKLIATISSTAINGLRGYYENTFSLSDQFVQNFQAIHRYYVSVLLWNYILSPSLFYRGLGVIDSVVERMIENFKTNTTTNSKEEPYISSLYFFDDINVSSGLSRDLLEDRDISLVFLNSGKSPNYLLELPKEAMLQNLIPIRIIKKQIKQVDFYSDEFSEIIYFYSKNERCKKMVEKFEFSKELPHTGLVISVKPLSPEEQRILVLEGILAATEKRLQYQTSVNSELAKALENRK